MSKFATAGSFTSPGNFKLMPFRFERLDDDCFLTSNIVGDFEFLTASELRRLIDLDLRPGDGLYERAFARQLVAREGQRSQIQLLAARMRSRMAFLRSPTCLHILVVTLRCEHSCPYCQVSRRSADRQAYDMSFETAMKAMAVVFQTPSPHLKIEFQGGEPLLNFELIERLVPEARAAAAAVGKTVDFVIATNLALIDEDILTFCKVHRINISTSLDGPADLHNKNRPRPGGNSHELAVSGMLRARKVLGPHAVSALMTTTEASLDRVEDIIDEYIRLDFGGIFLRPLSPYGFAVKTKQFMKYDSECWLDFYRRGLKHIIDINKGGRNFTEFYSSLLLQRMLTDRPTGFVDLRSPAGTALGALVYNYDGKIYAADEGRMLAEMGDQTFEIGDVRKDGYFDIILSDKVIDMVGRSLTQCAPQCSTCAFEPHCGADPVYHHATQGDYLGMKPQSSFCARQKGVMTHLLKLIDANNEDSAVLRRWAA